MVYNAMNRILFCRPPSWSLDYIVVVIRQRRRFHKRIRPQSDRTMCSHKSCCMQRSALQRFPVVIQSLSVSSAEVGRGVPKCYVCILWFYGFVILFTFDQKDAFPLLILNTKMESSLLLYWIPRFTFHQGGVDALWAQQSQQLHCHTADTRITS